MRPTTAKRRSSTLFHRDVKHRHFSTGTEVLLSGIQDALAVPPSIGQKALEEAALYKRERSLVYGAFLLVGRVETMEARDGSRRRSSSSPRRSSAGRWPAPLDLERHRMLRRAGLSVFPLSLASWAADESSCLEALERHPSLSPTGP